MGGIKNLYLICGDEEYLKEQQKAKLLTTLKCAGSMNYNAFSDDNIDIDEIASLMRTMPFMEPLRTISIDDSGWFARGTGANRDAGADETEDDSNYASVNDDKLEIFSDVPDTTVVIFTEKRVDRSNALYKLVKAKGEIMRFDMADSKSGKEKSTGRLEVRDWAKRELKAAGRRIDTRTLNELTELTGYDMQNLSTELEKLICYTLDKPKDYIITAADVNAICSKTIQDRVFDMIEFKLKGDVTRALAVLEELFAIKTAALMILRIITKQYEGALAYRECVDAGFSEAEIMNKLSIKDWQLRRRREQVGKTSRRELIARLNACADTEYRIKSGDVSDRLGIELLIAG